MKKQIVSKGDGEDVELYSVTDRVDRQGEGWAGVERMSEIGGSKAHQSIMFLGCGVAVNENNDETIMKHL